MNPWIALLIGLFNTASFAGGFFLAYRLRFWQAQVSQKIAREDDLMDAERSRMEEVIATQERIEKQLGGELREDSDSPLGAVPPTPDEVERTKRWKRAFRK